MKPLKPFYKGIYYVILVVAQLLVRILYPVRSIGRQNLPKNGESYVLVPNHLRAIDPLFVLMARGFDRKMLIMGKDELFEINPLLNFFWAVAGVFPIKRGSGDRGTVEQAMEQVKNGRPLLIFPEGTRSKDGKLHRLKSGAFVIAMEAGVPMVPCRIWYKKGKPLPFRRTTVVFGEPVSLEEMSLTGEYSPKKLREAKRIFSERLEMLYEQNRKKL